MYDLWAEQDAARRPAKKRNKRALPHPGQSYNPDPEDHQRLLSKIAKKELTYLKSQAALKKATKVKVIPSELKRHEKEELESGIKHLIKKPQPVQEEPEDDDDDSSELDTDSAYSDYDEKDFEAITKDKKVLEKRKTKKQRLAQLRDKLQRKAAKLRKLKNVRSSRFDAIKKILKELDRKEREKKPAGRHRKKLGYKLPDSDPIYCLSSELPRNLRETSCPMDAVVREQLESFQARLMVEPTRFQVKKRDRYKKRQYDRE